MTTMSALEFKKYLDDLKKKNKYKNNRSKCNQGHYHQSTLEAHYCDYLTFLKKIKQIKDYEIQVKYELYVNNVKITTHYPDFKVYFNDNHFEIHETKGKEMPEWIIKRNLFRALNPDIVYLVIKYFK